MGGHHLILGTLKDFLTGNALDDTLDERYRQQLARLLVEGRGYAKTEVTPRNRLLVQTDHRKAFVPVDLAVTLDGRVCMIVKYGPGSLVTRHRPALAASRLLTGYQIPLVVVTNGVDADILDGETGEKIASQLENIPSRRQVLNRVSGRAFPAITEKKAKLESRILYCYEVDDSCPCDDTVCKL